MPSKENIKVGSKGIRYGGQDPKMGITYATTDTVELGDIVAPSGVAGTVSRPADGGKILGLVISKERDAVCGVRTGLVHIARATGAVTPGFTDLAGDGAGGVKAVAAGSGTPCHVLGTEVDTGQTYVAFHVL
ncbi:hypothetical protein [Deinococcus hopiensis]|uniref:Uncharacterized protein n=1 Tax=Deinococcus hopiensis KR-140 TaxID=695939 RepID=A0A1W1V6Z0_9DEIO|nr:hypothetical protein [Deinococcus hopiensis]SMB89187.1 hypothetical protein SAMN00790413_00299 [Deinococcus hopiensis KR-140]